MDHSDLVLTGQKCSHSQHFQGQCAHGRCLDHRPEWENVGEVLREPNPGISGSKTWWASHYGRFIWCCGQRMAKYKEVQMRRCKKCGRTEDHVKNYYLALCLCCGYHFSNIEVEF